jgi:hypothetical protein
MIVITGIEISHISPTAPLLCPSHEEYQSQRGERVGCTGKYGKGYKVEARMESELAELR